MKLTQAEFQKIKRISEAIQQFLLQTGMIDARSTDLYEFLARKGLIEKDRHQGYHFRTWLRELKEANLLYLIPQCSFNINDRGHEWYFNLARKPSGKPTGPEKKASVLHNPAMTKEDKDLLMRKEKLNVENLPQRTDIKYTSQQMEIRKYYPRAYENWTEIEYGILERVYLQCRDMSAVATLLQRQPHIVKEKIERMKLPTD
jgi:hypothetical protein